MKSTIFFIFILSCAGSKNSSTRINNKLERIQSLEEFLANEAEKAISGDNIFKLKDLFSKGLRINKKYNGKSLLFRAVENDKKECTKYLISHGAIVSEEFEKSDLRDKSIQYDFVEVIWQKSPSLDNLSESILSFEELRKLQRKLAYNIFVKPTPKDCKNEEEYILNRILAGANINEVYETKDLYENKYKIIGLHSLSGVGSKGTEKILEEFLKRYERDINELDDEGRTSLSLAVEGGNLKFALTLLKNNSNPNIHENEVISSTPLPMALLTALGNIELIYLLIDKTERKDILHHSLSLIIKISRLSDKERIDIQNKIKERIKVLEKCKKVLEI